MQNYRTASHSVYDLKYHPVWITKYRKKVLYGQVAERLRDLLREICKTKDVEIIKGSLARDHIHCDRRKGVNHEEEPKGAREGGRCEPERAH